MEIVYPVCAGLDVHKKDVKACLVWRDAQGRRQQAIRTFGTTRIRGRVMYFQPVRC